MNEVSKRFVEYAKQRALESKGTKYEWSFEKLYPREEDVYYFLSVIEGCPRPNLIIEDEDCWDELMDWFEALPNY